ncbi:unnamed protein product [Phytomonas sp. EM1]|nr:unnamed protein product [Phytomonas sp. EM1]|eukprot:CCW65169.1 unnamed protein product [Phytomonas sp. isolate EM1]
MGARLLHRPPPVSLPDGVFESRVREFEGLAFSEMKRWMNGSCESMRQIEAQFSSFKIQAIDAHVGEEEKEGGQIAGVTTPLRLVVRELDWRVWGFDGRDHLRMGDLGEPIGLAETPLSAGEDAPLPFPRDLWQGMQVYVVNFTTATKGSRELRWFYPFLCFSRFTVGYPRGGGEVTIYGPLFLQQLFLAVAGYRRGGVGYRTLARRAGMEEGWLREILRPCVRRDRLLEEFTLKETGEEGVRMNYDFCPVEEAGKGEGGVEFSYDIPPPRVSAASAMSTRRGAPPESWVSVTRGVVVLIMKEIREASSEDLLRLAKGRLSKHFELNRMMFKNVVESLIENEILVRNMSGANEIVFRYAA